MSDLSKIREELGLNKPKPTSIWRNQASNTSPGRSNKAEELARSINEREIKRKEEEERRRLLEEQRRQANRDAIVSYDGPKMRYGDPEEYTREDPYVAARAMQANNPSVIKKTDEIRERKERNIQPYKEFNSNLNRDIEEVILLNRQQGLKEEDIKKSLIPSEDNKIEQRLKEISDSLKPGKEGLLQNIREGWQEKEIQNMISKETVREINGLSNNLPMIEEWLKEHPELNYSNEYRNKPEEWIDKATRFTFGSLPKQMLDSYSHAAKQPSTYAWMAAIMAVSALAAPVTGGASIATAPLLISQLPLLTKTAASIKPAAAIALGMRAGSYDNMAKLEMTSSYNELIEAGVDKRVAVPISATVGAFNGIVENLQLDGAMSMIPGFDDLVTKGSKLAKNEMTKQVTRVLKNYGQEVLTESLEEAMQGAISDIGLTLGEQLRDAPDTSTLEGLKAMAKRTTEKEFWEIVSLEGYEAMKSMWLSPLVSSAGRTVAGEGKYRFSEARRQHELIFGKEGVVDQAAKAVTEHNNMEAADMLLKQKHIIDAVSKQDDVLKREKTDMSKASQKISETIGGLLYEAKEKEPTITYKPSNEIEVSEMFLSDDFTFEQIVKQNPKANEYNLDLFREANRQNVLPTIREGLINKKTKAEIANEITKVLPKKMRGQMEVLSMINAVEIFTDEAKSQAILNSFTNLAIAQEILKDKPMVETEIEIDQETDTIQGDLREEDIEGNVIALSDDENLVTEAQEPVIEEQAIEQATQENIGEIDVKEDQSPEKEVAATQDLIKNESLAPEGKYRPSENVMVPLKDINVDPETFQFRYEQGNEGGATRKLEGAEYNPMLAGSILLWEDEYNDLYVVNGHHRVDLAKKSNVSEMSATIIKHTEYTKEEARAAGAMINIAEDNATSIDVAKLIRDTGVTEAELKAKGVRPGSKIFRDGMALSKLNNWIFTNVATRAIPIERAVIIGTELADNAEGQNQIIRTISELEARGKTITNAVLTEMLAEVKGTAQESFTEQTLFGAETMTKNFSVERAEIVGYVKGQLKDRVSILKNVSKEKNASLLQELGNTIAIDDNVKEMNTADQALWILDKTLNYKGTKVNEAFNNLAKDYANANPGDRMAIKKQALNKLIKMMEGGDLFETINTGVEGKGAGSSSGDIKTDGQGEQTSFGISPGEADRQVDLFGEETISQLQKIDNVKIIKADDVENTKGYKETKDIAKAMNNNVFLNGLTIEYTGKSSIVELTRGELDERGYKHAKPGKYSEAGYYISETDTSGRIVLNDEADRTTIVEEAIHHIQARAEEINPEFARLVKAWEDEINFLAESYEIDIPQGKELFAQAFVFGELGHADKGSLVANMVAIDDKLVEIMKTMLGEDILSLVQGQMEPEIVKNERILRTKDKYYQLKGLVNENISSLYDKRDFNYTDNFKVTNKEYLGLIVGAKNGQFKANGFDNLVLNNNTLSSRQKNDLLGMIQGAVEKGLDVPNERVNLNQFMNRFYNSDLYGVKSEKINKFSYELRFNPDNNKIELGITNVDSNYDRVFDVIDWYSNLSDAIDDYKHRLIEPERGITLDNQIDSMIDRHFDYTLEMLQDTRNIFEDEARAIVFKDIKSEFLKFKDGDENYKPKSLNYKVDVGPAFQKYIEVDSNVGYKVRNTRISKAYMTNHFGTGTYFTSGDTKFDMSNSAVDLGSSVIFTDYNLFKPTDEIQVSSLINILRGINENYDDMSVFDDEFHFITEKRLKDSGLDISKERAINLVGEVKRDIEASQVDDGSRRGPIPMTDLPSTYFMQKLGYEGIDVRHLEGYDNDKYGSVIYELKEDRPSFQLKDFEPIGENTPGEGNLLAVHNITEGKLFNAIKLGGFPVASFAITKKGQTHTNFGEISLIFKSDTIDPNNRDNKVYGADVYSPRFPRVSYDIDGKKMRDLASRLQDISGMDAYLDESQFNDMDIDEATDRLMYKDFMKVAFLNESNQAIDIPMMSPGTRFQANDFDVVANFIREHDLSYVDILENEGLREQYFTAIRDGFSEAYHSSPELASNIANREIEKIRQHIEFDAKVGLHENDPHVVQLTKDFNIAKGLLEQVKDTRKYNDLVDKAITGQKEQFRDYVKSNIEPLYGEVGLRNDKDLFTPSGRRRSWKQLHDAYHIDNVLKLMKGSMRDEEGFNYGLGNVRAGIAEEFKSLDDIRRSQDLLVDKETFEVEKERYNKVYENLKTQSSKFHFQKYGNAFDYAMGEVSKKKRINNNTVMSALEGNEFRVNEMPGELISEITDFIKSLKTMPTEYFEAIPQRVVGLDEIQAVVAPNNLSPEMEQVLRDHGINLIEKYGQNSTIGWRKFGENSYNLNTMDAEGNLTFNELELTIEDIRNKMGDEVANEILHSKNEWGKIKGKDRQAAMDNVLRQKDISFQLKPVNTETQEFKAWFKDSKVVDEEGKPLAVYHGSPNTFDTFRPNNAIGWGEGIYFTDNINAASEYGYKEDGSNLYKVYLDIQNPYTGDVNLSYEDIENTKVYRKTYDEMIAKGLDDYDIDAMELFNEDGDFANKVIRELGYDGIIMEGSNNIDGKEIVVFEPTQIKSTDNRGTWDATDPNIYYQMKDINEENFKPSSWKKTVEDYNFTNPELRELLQSEQLLYEVKHNADTILRAAKLIDEKGEKWVHDRVMGDIQNDADIFAAAQILIAKYQAEGNNDLAREMIYKTSEKATSAGQAIQILSNWNRQSPQGMVRMVTGEFERLMTGKDKIDINKGAIDLSNGINNINRQTIETIELTGTIKDIKEMTPEEMLAKRIAATLSEKSASKKDAMQTMIDTLFKVAQESPLPDQKSKPTNPMQFVVEAIVNREKYRDVWAKAKDIIAERFKDDPAKMEILKDYFDKGIFKTFADTHLKKAVGKELSDMNVKINDIVKKHYSEGQKLTDSLVDKLVKEAGLSGIEAEILAKYITDEMDNRTKAAKESLLNNMFKDRKLKNERKTLDSRILEMSNLGAFSDKNYKHLVAEKLGMPVMTDELMDFIYEKAEHIQTLEEGSRERDVETALLIKEVSKNIPVSKWAKASTLQAMSHLLNIRTTARNLIGNEIFSKIDTINNNYLGAGIDTLLSLITGQRTTAHRNIFKLFEKQYKAYGEEFKLGVEDALMGINTSENKTKFELRPDRTFRSGPLATMETLMDITMRATDRAAQAAGYADSIQEQLLLSGLDTPTEQMVEMAERLGLYRTFNDTTALSEAFSGIKRHLNILSSYITKTTDFGLGDLVLKYPSTPANIMARAIDYSPIGLILTALEFANDKSGDSYMKQKMAVEGISRAMSGTMIMGAGMLLATLGIVTGGNPDDDEDIYALQKQYGLKDYSVNVSAFNRHLASGFKDQAAGELRPGDTIATYDWAEPVAMGIAVGADTVLGSGEALDMLGTVISSWEAGAGALTEQPLLTGLTRLFGYGDPVKGLSNAITDLPSSFTPSLLSQISNAMDGSSKNMYDFYPKGRQIYNSVINKIPGMKGQLPNRYSTLGEKLEYYPDETGIASRVMKTMISPALYGEYNPSSAAQLVFDLYEKTGEKDHIPRKPQKSYIIEDDMGDKIKYTFTPESYAKLSEWVGKEYETRVNYALRHYMGDWTAFDQVEEIKYIINDLGNDTKEKVKQWGTIVE